MFIHKTLIVTMYMFSLANSFNFTEGIDKMKFLLNEFRNRHRRCTNPKLESFVIKSVNFLHETERFRDFLTHFNVSDCVTDLRRNSEKYLSEHILQGLLLHEHLPDIHWHEYKQVHKKQYASDLHEMAAVSKWRENARRVALHNKHYLSGKHKYSLHLNHFGDLGSLDYFRKVLKLIDTVQLFDPAEDHYKTTFRTHSNRRIPKSMDWRSAGFKPRREEQWQCGACYAFAVTHAVQAQLYKRHAAWTELSPQQIVDCSYADGNEGCEGGSLRAALRYAAREGLVMEKYYPYAGKKGVCRSGLLPRVRTRRWATLPSGDDRAIETALATIGPLAVAVNAAPFTFQLYRNGIYDDPFCFPFKLNHAMLMVGYTPEYWVLLNWWGPNWGEDGYMSPLCENENYTQIQKQINEVTEQKIYEGICQFLA